ncbi:MAG: hypothetical protein OXP08_03635 [bacterium]|nr:hypothetical protein [bacterium]
MAVDRLEPWPDPYLLESGQSRWVCGDDGRNPPYGDCWWPLDGLWSPGEPWSVKVYWKWCPVSRRNCPGDPFDDEAETATAAPASESS